MMKQDYLRLRELLSNDEELRAEYMRDTGREYFSRQEEAKARALKELAELGIPFDPDDWPFEDIR